METREERGEESGISSKIFCLHVKMLFLLSMGGCRKRGENESNASICEYRSPLEVYKHWFTLLKRLETKNASVGRKEGTWRGK